MVDTDEEIVPRTCILIGADGEDPDDCTTHEHEEPESLQDACYYCRCQFTEEEWDQRHSDAAGEDVHEECCDVCHGDNAAHRELLQYDRSNEGD